MSKLYRLTLEEIDQATGHPKQVVYEGLENGYYLSHVMRSLAKRIYEPAPVVRLEGQEVMDL